MNMQMYRISHGLSLDSSSDTLRIDLPIFYKALLKIDTSIPRVHCYCLNTNHRTFYFSHHYIKQNKQIFTATHPPPPTGDKYTLTAATPGQHIKGLSLHTYIHRRSPTSTVDLARADTVQQSMRRLKEIMQTSKRNLRILPMDNR